MVVTPAEYLLAPSRQSKGCLPVADIKCREDGACWAFRLLLNAVDIVSCAGCDAGSLAKPPIRRHWNKVCTRGQATSSRSEQVSCRIDYGYVVVGDYARVSNVGKNCIVFRVHIVSNKSIEQLLGVVWPYPFDLNQNACRRKYNRLLFYDNR